MNKKLTRWFNFLGPDFGPGDFGAWVAAALVLLILLPFSSVFGIFGGLPSTKWELAFQTDLKGCSTPPTTQLELDLQRQSIRFARNNRDGAIRADGDVDPGGKLKIALSYAQEGTAAVTGKLDRHYGSGTWQSTARCNGKWTAVDIRPTNKW